MRARTHSSSRTCSLPSIGADDHHCARRATAAGGDRSADRPDLPRLRADHWRAVGAPRPRRAGAGEHDAAGVPEQRLDHRANGSRPGPCGNPDGGGSRHRDRNIRGRPGAWRGQRRVQPRRGAERARARGAGPAAVHAARGHAEQRRSRDHAGRPDPDSNRRQQHGHGHVQGRGADAQGDATDHERRHRHHEDHRRERVRRTSAARWAPLRFRRSTRSAR